MLREVILDKKLKILPEGCAIINNNTMVIADLHLGYEGVLVGNGLFMPRVGLKDMIGKIEAILNRESKLKTLVVNGDLKHEFSELHRFEWKDVDDFVRYATNKFDEIVVVRGNHDNYLKLLLKKYGIEMHDSYYEMGEFVLTHGDKLSMSFFTKKRMIIGHEHPSMVIKDSVNVKTKVPCFLYGNVSKSQLLVLPAFSPLFPGTDVLSIPSSALLSPILRKYGIDNMRIYACVEEDILPFPEVRVVRQHAP